MNATKSLFLCALCACTAVFAAGCGDNNKDESAPDASGKVEVPAKPDGKAKAAEVSDDTVVAKVGGEKLTYGEAMKNIKRMLGAQGAPEDQLDMIARQMASRALPQLAEHGMITTTSRPSTHSRTASSWPVRNESWWKWRRNASRISSSVTRTPDLSPGLLISAPRGEGRASSRPPAAARCGRDKRWQAGRSRRREA